MSAFSISEPFPTFHDRDGQPLEAGYLYFGVAGLDPVTNPVTVYWDAALTIPAAQPVRTLNGYPSNNGTASRLYVNASDFSTSVRDSKNTLVFTSLNSTLRIPGSSITGQFSSSQVSYTQGDIGSQSRTVESKLQDSVSVFDFMTPAQVAGVKAGTFLVDVTAAINAAIASPAREIYFPQGGYLVDNGGSGFPSIYIPPNTVAKTLRGSDRQSTVIRNVGNAVAIASEGTPIIPNTSIHIADMSIEGSAGTADGILFTYTAQSIIERVDCYAHGASGIKLINGAHISVSDAWSHSNTGVALEIGGDAFFLDVRGGTFESSASGALIFNTGVLAPRYVTFTGCAFRNNSNSNVDIGQALDIRFIGCWFESINGGSTQRHLQINGGVGIAAAIVANGCSFYGVNALATTIGIIAQNCEDVTISNSLIDCSGAVAYDIKVTATRTCIYDNAIIFGAKNNASSTTFVRQVESLPSAALEFYTGTATTPIKFQSPNNVSLIRFGDERLWAASDHNVYTFFASPANSTDGYVVGPGCHSSTYGLLPGAPPVGTRALCTDCTVTAWGAVVNVGGGANKRFVIWTGTQWTIFGVG